uniref:Protein kinase domain-containing protein n=1 Tax=Triticum urartu TaxID=4572 RepID=A0A8R7PMK3_TRIUA
VRREVKILKALAGHKNLVQFYDAYEDNENVYIVMELAQFYIQLKEVRRYSLGNKVESIW